MIELSNIKLPLDVGIEGNQKLLYRAVTEAVGIDQQAIKTLKILKRSVDARKKQQVHFVATIGIELASDAAEECFLKESDYPYAKKHEAYADMPIPNLSDLVFEDESVLRPVVVGTGPAGLFAAWYLAKAGLRPLVLEQGRAIEERLSDVKAFSKEGRLLPYSNIQFGEGGAGTFSDGKLTTNTKNPLTKHVLKWFVEAGAPEEILWQAKPHIGTDNLVEVVHTIREQIIALGGEVLFSTALTGVQVKHGALEAIEITKVLNGETYVQKAHQLILATGHSARKTFAMLNDAGLVMEQKPFSVGVRIEHSQAAISRAQYGPAADHPALGAADYKLAVHLDSGRSVYTFCMCPGGEVVCAASEPETVVVNGMSRFARDSENANSAVLVSIEPADFKSEHPLAGIEFQRRIEKAAYDLALSSGGSPYQAPAQRLGEFLEAGKKDAKEQDRLSIQASYARGVVWCDLHDCLPGFVAEALEEAFPLLDRKLKGFADKEAVLTGVETRSSSPVRICRNENFQASFSEDEGPSVGITDNNLHHNENAKSGLYPCGEGAGYAGGIMSAAVDGLRIAEALCQDVAVGYGRA